MRFSAAFLLVFGVTAVLVLPASGQTPSATGQVIATKTMDRFYDPVEFRSEMLEGLLGKKISHLRLYSFVEGSFRQVPYQIDEWSEDGFLVMDQGTDQNGELSNGILDDQDMLVFMARDAGDRVSRDLWPQVAGQGIEIEILDPSTGGKGWCYLLHFPESAPETSFPMLVALDDTEMFLGKGSTYRYVGTNQISGDRVYKTVSANHIWITPEGGGDGRDFIDRNKVRFEVRFLFGMLRIRLDESNFVGGASKYKKGPVRCVIRSWLGFKLPFRLHNLKTPKFYIDDYCYDTMVLVGATTSMPFNPGYVVTDLKMSIGYDLHDPRGYGMRWYNSNNLEGFLADGVTSPMEAEYDNSLDRWKCIIGPNGWMVHTSSWDKEYYEQADIKSYYKDDIKSYSPPENYPGNLAYYRTLSTIKDLEPRKYRFQMDWYWPYNLYDPDGVRLDIIDQIVNIKEKPLVIKVGSRQVTNNGPFISPVEP